MQAKWKKRARFLVKLAVTVGILYYLLQSGKLNLTRLVLFWHHPAFLVSTLLLLVLVVVPITALRWWMLLRALGIRVPIGRAFHLTWIGNFFNTTLPGSVSGDFVKGFYIVKANRKGEKTKAFTTLIIDRFTGMFGLIVMAFVALLFNWPLIAAQPGLQPLATAVAVLFAVTVFFYGIVLLRFDRGNDPFVKLLEKLPKSAFLLKVYDTFKTYQNHKGTLIGTLLLSIGVHTIISVLFFMIARMMGVQNIAVATQMFIMPIGLITVAIPIAPGGVGIGHAAFDTLYQFGGISGGADIFNLYIILQLAVYLLGGVFYFLYNGEYRLPDADAREIAPP